MSITGRITSLWIKKRLCHSRREYRSPSGWICCGAAVIVMQQESVLDDETAGLISRLKEFSEATIPEMQQVTYGTC